MILKKNRHQEDGWRCVGRTQERIDFVNFATILRWLREFRQRWKICILPHFVRFEICWFFSLFFNHFILFKHSTINSLQFC